MPRDGYTAGAPGGITLAGSMPGTTVYRAFWASAAPELEGDAVHAIPKARRLGPVREDVAQIPPPAAGARPPGARGGASGRRGPHPPPPAAAGMPLGAHGEEASVRGVPDGPLDRRPEGGPPRPAVLLRVGGKEGQIAGGTGERAPAGVRVQRARAGA